MSHHKLQESLDIGDSFTTRELLQALGIAALLVSAVFVLVGLLLLPVAPV